MASRAGASVTVILGTGLALASNARFNNCARIVGNIALHQHNMASVKHAQPNQIVEKEPCASSETLLPA